VENVILFKKVCGFFAKIQLGTTSALRIYCFQNLKEAIDILRMMNFPLIILMKGTHACHHHIVVTWRGMIIDYDSKYTLPLTNDSLRHICGVNTIFDGKICGYGIFLPNHIHNYIDTGSVVDWGINEYNIKGSPIMKYFLKKVSQ
jgi:hypothetical protein